jgi:hypothetical protein
MTHNQGVVGSSPTGPTLKIKGLEVNFPQPLFSFAYHLHTKCELLDLSHKKSPFAGASDFALEYGLIVRAVPFLLLSKLLQSAAVAYPSASQ